MCWTWFKFVWNVASVFMGSLFFHGKICVCLSHTLFFVFDNFVLLLLLLLLLLLVLLLFHLLISSCVELLRSSIHLFWSLFALWVCAFVFSFERIHICVCISFHSIPLFPSCHMCPHIISSYINILYTFFVACTRNVIYMSTKTKTTTAETATELTE